MCEESGLWTEERMDKFGLFEKLPASLFAPLAAKNAAFYSEVLLVLFAEAQHHQEPVSRELLLTLVIDVFEMMEEIDVSADLTDEEDVLNFESQNDTRSRAGAVLRYLIRCQWLHEEVQGDFSVAYTLPDYAFRILSTFFDITTDMKAPLQGLICTIHDLLQAAVREGDELIRISQAHRETQHLLNALKELQHNIGVHIEVILHQTAPHLILEQAFGAYLHEITRRAYHELRTTDHVSRFRPGINAALMELSKKDYYSVGGVTEHQNGQVRREHDAQRILEQLQEIRDQFDRLDGLLHAIDSRHSQFFESAIRSIEHMLLASSTTSGHLHTILSYLLSPCMREIADDEAMKPPFNELSQQLVTLDEFTLLDTKSLAPVRRTRESFTPDPQEYQPLDDEAILAAQQETLEQMFRAVSRTRVRKLAEDLLCDYDERCASDFPFSGAEDLPLLIYLKVYGDGTLGYVAEELEKAEKIERNDIGFHNFRIRRTIPPSTAV